MGALYLVPTPIGNLEDITLRALRILREVSLIAAEDTRVTRKLLAHYDIQTRLTSYHEHNEADRTPVVLDRLAEGDVALVSDAGMPSISDPGFRLVHQAAKRGIQVVALPGASAVTTALATSGLPVDQFLYLGFLPRRAAQRRQMLDDLRDRPSTLVMFETPHRLSGSLKDILVVLGNRDIAVCREMTKLYEEVFRGTVSEAIDHFQEPRGEFTLVVGGGEPFEVGDDLIAALLVELQGEGMTTTHAVREAAQRLGIARKRAYALALRAKRDT